MAPTNKQLLKARGLSVRVGKRRLLEPTDFTVDRGQWIALIGPNGAGKSTLIKALATLMPSEGELYFSGEDVRQSPVHYRRALGVVMHEPLLYRELSAVENLTLFAKLYDVTEAQEKITTGLQQVGLSRVMNEPIHRFSRGMMQRLALARALLHAPAILLLDEPLSGIDERGTGDMTALFQYVKQRGTAGIWVTHNWQKAWTVVDEVWEMDRGVIVKRTSCSRELPADWRPLHSISDEKLMRP